MSRCGVVPALLALAFLAGCGGPASSSGFADASQGASQGATHQVRVGLTEWSIEVSSSRVVPGRVRLVVTNAGATEHDLVVAGKLGSWSTHDLAPGQRARLVVRARGGEVLRLWCSMPGHRAQGMHTTLTAVPPHPPTLRLENLQNPTCIRCREQHAPPGERLVRPSRSN